MITKLTFITSNPSKAEQLGIHLNFPVAHLKLELPEIQSLDLVKATQYKATQAFKLVNKPVLVEDTSLVFNSLGKLPGPFIKWFYEELGNEGICSLISKYPDKSASAQVAFGLQDDNGTKIFTGTIKGSIADKPRGQAGFSWDPIFIPEG